MVGYAFTVAAEGAFELPLLGELELECLELGAEGLEDGAFDDCLDELLDSHGGELLGERALLEGLQQRVLEEDGVEGGRKAHILNDNYRFISH